MTKSKIKLFRFKYPMDLVRKIAMHRLGIRETDLQLTQRQHEKIQQSKNSGNELTKQGGKKLEETLSQQIEEKKQRVQQEIQNIQTYGIRDFEFLMCGEDPALQPYLQTSGNYSYARQVEPQPRTLYAGRQKYSVNNVEQLQYHVKEIEDENQKRRQQFEEEQAQRVDQYYNKLQQKEKQIEKQRRKSEREIQYKNQVTAKKMGNKYAAYQNIIEKEQKTRDQVKQSLEQKIQDNQKNHQQYLHQMSQRAKSCEQKIRQAQNNKTQNLEVISEQKQQFFQDLLQKQQLSCSKSQQFIQQKTAPKSPPKEDTDSLYSFPKPQDQNQYGHLNQYEQRIKQRAINRELRQQKQEDEDESQLTRFFKMRRLHSQKQQTRQNIIQQKQNQRIEHNYENIVQSSYQKANQLAFQNVNKPRLVNAISEEEKQQKIKCERLRKEQEIQALRCKLQVKEERTKSNLIVQKMCQEKSKELVGQLSPTQSQGVRRQVKQIAQQLFREEVNQQNIQ